MELLKSKDQPLTEELVASLVEKLIYVPTNMHPAPPGHPEPQVNVWFAGQVAGFEKGVVRYDFQKNDFFEEPKIFYNVILTDSMAYVLSPTEVEIYEITLEEFNKMVEEHRAKLLVQEAVDKKILVPNSKEIILPSDVH